MLKICLTAILIFMLLSGYCLAGENDGQEITQAESLGGGEYITDSGKIMQLEDLGEGQFMTDDENYLQEGVDDSRDFMTSDEEMVQVDE